MQRRHSSNTESVPPERSRSQTLGPESSLDGGGGGGGVFDSPACPQQLFSLVGVSSASVVPSSAPFQSGGLVLASSPEVFIQMTSLSREEGAGGGGGGPHHNHHHHRSEGSPFLTRPTPHHHHHLPFHAQALQHRGSSLLHSAAASVGGGDRQGGREEGPEEPPAPALSELKAVATWLHRGFPFVLILLAKVCFQHKLGIAVCVGMASTFAFANSTFKHQVSLREERSVLVALWIMVFLAGNVGYLYYTFSSEELHNSLMFSKPNINSADFFHLIWAVGITDFVLKYLTIAIKCLVLFLPKILLAFKSRGKFYLVLEELSQLLRALVPIQLWYHYIMGEEPSGSYFLGAVLIIIYSLCKSFDLCGRISSIRKAMAVLCNSQSYGVRASSQQCTEAGGVCAICQANFRDPVALLCQHVFCDGCLGVWLDRERSCPLCRSSVLQTLRCWKDGTTSAHFQIY